MTFKLSDLINHIFPPHCISCWEQGCYLCKTCKKRLTPHPEICPYCHRFSEDYRTCLNCRTEKNNYLEGIIIPFAYCDEIKCLILKLKYFHKKDVIDFLTDRLIIALQINKTTEIFNKENQQIITYVPSHRWRRFFVKWYNQSQLLAANLAKKLNIPYAHLLQKTKHTHSQAQLTRKQRLTNLQNAFTLQTPLQGTEIIYIIDDVTTTWATINTLAKTIKTQYPKTKIRGIVIGRHLG